MTDAATGRPVIGVKVSVRRGGDEVGADQSDGEGRFQVTFDVGTRREAQYLKLMLSHDDYAAAAEDVEVVSGFVTGGPVRIALLPKAVATCRVSKGHAVIVGHFRAPLTGPQGVDLAASIRDALEYELVPHLQKPLRQDAPFVASCGEVSPQSGSFYPAYARALGADVLIGGSASAAGQRFVVDMRVSDRFGALGELPRVAKTQPLDLDDPHSAHLGATAHAPILLGLAVGYEKAGLNPQCVEVTTVAEAVLGSLPPEIRAVREACQHALPNRGLLPGDR